MSGDKLWELSQPDWRCWGCDADAAEVSASGHRRLSDGHGGDVACPEACSCRPEHRSIAEHLAECGSFVDAPTLRQPKGRAPQEVRDADED